MEVHGNGLRQGGKKGLGKWGWYGNVCWVVDIWPTPLPFSALVSPNCRKKTFTQYRIALNFQGLKFSQIVSFEIFVEILRKFATAHIIYYGCEMQAWLSNMHDQNVVCLNSQLSEKQRLL